MPRTARGGEQTTLQARRRRSAIMTSLVWCASAICLLPLVLITAHLLVGGARVLGPRFFTALPTPPGVSGGGIANGIAGTLLLLLVAAAIGLPIGLGAGLFLAERTRTRLAETVRFLADVLSGLPSIVIGIFVWELIVRPSGQFSALAGGVALGVLMIPLITRATEAMVQLVPNALREAALALGYSRARTSLTIVLRTALPGIVTASLLAVARVAGETAPLLFTAFGTPYWSLRLDAPIAALPLQIFNYATSPYDDWRAQAWGGALVLIVLVFALSWLARRVTESRRERLNATVAGGAAE
ncbi:MAG: phosphate ABC transporter permease PstA [Gemmatimonadaceae bacterium]|jgi:phosphate transport system permease protein|nr:phosphate ABC transporter permease PstA [Gemmatimonadaceae bacterium]